MIKEVVGVGVGAVVIHPDQRILVVTEQNTRRFTRKLEGMMSIPMETQELGESDEDTLRRSICGEETTGLSFAEQNLTQNPLAEIQFWPGIWLKAYALHATHGGVQIGSDPATTDARWVDIDEILTAPKHSFGRTDSENLPDFLRPPVSAALKRFLNSLEDDKRVNVGSLRWRPGTEEAITCLKEFMGGNRDFLPRTYLQPNDTFPTELFSYLGV